MSEQEKPKKFRNIVLDTLNGLLTEEVIKTYTENTQPTFTDWRDYGVGILDLVNFIKTIPNVIPVAVLGAEGTGKTVGASFLNPEETYYINLDKKPLSFKGWSKVYKAGKIAEGGNYNNTISDFNTLKKLIGTIQPQAENPLIIYVLGHLENYKFGGQEMSRLKVTGKMAHRYSIDGLFHHCYYTYIDASKQWNDVDRYQLITANLDGNMTARTPMGTWDKSHIPNNFQTITDKILEEYQ